MGLLEVQIITKLALELFREPLDPPLPKNATDAEVDAAFDAHARKVFARRRAQEEANAEAVKRLMAMRG